MTGARRQARAAALQILYWCEIGQTDATRAFDAFFPEHYPDAGQDVRTFAERLVRGTQADLPAIDPLIAQHSRHWRLGRMATLDRLVLRMAIWEFRHEAETPPAVVINEAVELARQFSGEESVAFVNGVLDAVRRTTTGDSAAREASPHRHVE